MLIQNINNETIIRVPNSVNFAYMQDFIDYLSVKTILSKSQATDEQIDKIAEDAQAQWWKKNKSKFLKWD
jgi:hypothetical protein